MKLKIFCPFMNFTPNEDYYIGLFLTGAYQDVMGDLHNLFGRLNEVHVFCDDEDPTDFYIEEVIKGSSAESVLRAMQYNPEAMAYTMKKNIDRQIASGKINPREGVRLVDFYEECLGILYIFKKLIYEVKGRIMKRGPVSEFMLKHYCHFNAASVIDASRGWEAHLANGGKMFVTIAGAMSTAELGKSLAEMIRQNKIHAICCTGANLEEDIYNLVAHNHYQRVPDWSALNCR